MLVLTRNTHEAIVVGGSCGFNQLFKVTVLQISGDRVKLGFDIDPNIPVHRWEVYERIIAGERPNKPTVDDVVPHPVGRPNGAVTGMS